MVKNTELARTLRGARAGPNGIIVKAVVKSDAEREDHRRALLQVDVCEGADSSEFVVRTPVAASAETVYALVDWANEHNRFRQIGDSVTALDDDGKRFRLVISYMPDLAFDYEVLEASRPHVYHCICVPKPIVGHLERSDELYRIERADDEHCAVTYRTIATFEAGLNADQSAQVKRHMTIACHNSVAKLKAAAEHGVGTMAAFNATYLMSL